MLLIMILHMIVKVIALIIQSTHDLLLKGTLMTIQGDLDTIIFLFAFSEGLLD